MTSRRNLSPSEIETIARQVFRQEMAQARLVSEDGIRIIAGQIFDNRIVPTSDDIKAIQDKLDEFATQLTMMGGRVQDTQSMLHQLHSFGKGGQPGFFEVRAAQDDVRWEKLEINLGRIIEADHRRGIVDEAKKIIEDQKDKRNTRYGMWVRWGLPLLAGATWASFWRVLQNYARSGGHLPPWIQHVVDALAK